MTITASQAGKIQLLMTAQHLGYDAVSH